MDKELWKEVWDGNLRQFSTPYVSKESVQAYITNGLVPSSAQHTIDLDSVIDMRFLDQAVQRLGWSDVPR
ncbi:hypothetical protein [Microvirga tunisiensis]|uniref:Uncharacterized protein n=1 Tax=Microvirga tunisiensis TaxID=2108360 RepID=A0A5N7MTI6_9HYPH|nr:hypothetical protein [Microvirga tunisiensis]MPR05440.1 hypothetical protein [Microvirga tunisiensis]MPR30301.1 hypothetical protein [Microvirga tunisiensis]